MAKIFATLNPEISDREIRNMERARRIAAQGMVLLENNGALPLNEGIKSVALFGNGARRTVKGGTGSGDVNSREVINAAMGLEACGLKVTTNEWMDRFDKTVEDAHVKYNAELLKAIEADEKAFWRLFTDPFKEPAIIPVTAEDIEASKADAAIYVLSRNSGEGKDRVPSEGDYELLEVEKEAVKRLAEYYGSVIVVLNVGGVVDTKFFRETEGIGAVLLMSQAGNIGGYALADVLTGKVSPSGHLATTWAEDYSDYPAAMHFSHMNGDIDDEYYLEGIFVGYRYFDSFNIDPAYPFGYGLSYTDFKLECLDTKLIDGRIEVKVRVTNTGDKYSGKEVVQVYYSAPKGKLDKPYQELCAFAKTGELMPGESEELCISFPVTEMASYDEAAASFILEAGDYYIRVGNHSRNTEICAAVRIDKEAVTKVLANMLALDADFDDLSNEGVMPYTYETEEAEKAAAKVILVSADSIICETAVYTKDELIAANASEEKIKLTDVKAGRAKLDELVGQLTIEEMTELCVGTARGGPGSESIIGAASIACPGAAGDTTSTMLEDREIMNMVLADGPAGLRLSRYFKVDSEGNVLAGSVELPLPELEIIFGGMPKAEVPEDAKTYYQYCTAIPIATLLAQTWDMEAVKEAGDIVGEEMEELGVTLWLAPGMNIHRNPLCGRNFEYYSEDPLMSGVCASADTLGVQKHSGVGTTIKHFAFNNQEDNRQHVSSHISERAIREIYLKGFEIAVKASAPMSIMTSYNLINGIHTANSEELINRIARDEWGFEGIVMTDWGTTGSIDMATTTLKYGCSSPRLCMKAGNDLIMPGSFRDVEDIVEAAKSDEAILAALQACSKRMLALIMQSSSYENSVPYAVDKIGIEGYIDVKRM